MFRAAFTSAVIPAACLLLLLVAALAACSADDDPADNRHPAPGDPGTIRFTSTIGHFADADNPDGFAHADNPDSSAPADNPDGSAHPALISPDAAGTAPATRALISTADGRGTFEEGDRINIITHVFDTTVDTDHPATYHDGAWLTDLTWEDFGPGAKVDFTAYFPALLFSQLNPQTIDIPTDQSTPGKYAAADYLFLHAIGQQQSDTPIELRFVHAMHRLVVKLVLDEHPGSLTQADLDAATVVIKNAPIRGMATLKNGIETDYVTEGDILPLPLGDNTFCALIPWMDNSKPRFFNESIEVRAAGTVASYPIQWSVASDIYANHQTLIRLTLADNEGLGNYITTYAALKSACEAATGTADNPTRITLGADIEFPGTTSDCINISRNQYIEINGNGYRLTRAATAELLFMVFGNASLKLTRMTVDGENKETDMPLIDVSTLQDFSDFIPGTLTLGEGFMLTGAALPAADASDNAYKLNRTPGINVSGTLIMEKGSQVTGNGRGYPVRLTGSTRAILRLNGGTFGNNTDADLCLV